MIFIILNGEKQHGLHEVTIVVPHHKLVTQPSLYWFSLRKILKTHEKPEPESSATQKSWGNTGASMDTRYERIVL